MLVRCDYILGVSSTGSQEEVRAAFHEQLKRWHPDHQTSAEDKAHAEERTRLIIAAYREFIYESAKPRAELVSEEQTKEHSLRQKMPVGAQGRTAARRSPARFCARMFDNACEHAVTLMLVTYLVLAIGTPVSLTSLSGPVYNIRDRVVTTFSTINNALMGGRRRY